MPTWSIEVLADGRFRVWFVDKVGACAVECGICPAHTEPALVLEWVAIESEPFDVIVNIGEIMVKLPTVRE
jgi:hypothetical protein